MPRLYGSQDNAARLRRFFADVHDVADYAHGRYGGSDEASRLIKVPVHELAMMMSIALRFIPTLIGETDKMVSAKARRDFSSGNIVRRAKR